MKAVFRNIYKSNGWKSKESVSGPGSAVSRTIELRQKLLQIITNFNIKSVVDIPCGDLNWISPILDKIPNYVGIDIVDELILKNKKKFNNNIFYIDDIRSSEKLNCDLLIVRDALFHFSRKNVMLALKNIKKNNPQYILTTEVINKNHKNKNIRDGAWHPIALQNSPYNFPEPIFKIKEDAKHKYICLWKVKDI